MKRIRNIRASSTIREDILTICVLTLTGFLLKSLAGNDFGTPYEPLLTGVYLMFTFKILAWFIHTRELERDYSNVPMVAYPLLAVSMGNLLINSIRTPLTTIIGVNYPITPYWTNPMRVFTISSVCILWVFVQKWGAVYKQTGKKHAIVLVSNNVILPGETYKLSPWKQFEVFTLKKRFLVPVAYSRPNASPYEKGTLCFKAEVTTYTSEGEGAGCPGYDLDYKTSIAKEICTFLDNNPFSVNLEISEIQLSKPLLTTIWNIVEVTWDGSASEINYL